jgi:molybdopterin synthase sulfur carrier subunit
MKVWFSTHLRAYTKCTETEAEAASVSALVDELESRYKGLKFRIVDEQDRIRDHIAVFVNTEQARELSVPLKPTDSVRIIGALSGGG